MSTDTDAEPAADVVPCRVCESPVFDDELYCEACGATVKPEASPAAATRLRTTTRDERDCGALAAISDVGLRRVRNEDAFAIAHHASRSVVAVCDGVASTANGDQAARAAADAALGVLETLLGATEWPDEDGLRRRVEEAFDEAQRSVLHVPGDDDPYGNDASPSTTLVVAAASPEGVVVGNVGDSRAYWLCAETGHSMLLTVDDSIAQEMIAQGVPTKVAYDHPDADSITRWIGGDTDSWTPTLTVLEPGEAGLLVVCSDGLWNYFDDPELLAGLVPWPAPPPLEIARLLTAAALNAGGRDNITVAVIPLGASERATESQE